MLPNIHLADTVEQIVISELSRSENYFDETIANFKLKFDNELSGFSIIVMQAIVHLKESGEYINLNTFKWSIVMNYFATCYELWKKGKI